MTDYANTKLHSRESSLWPLILVISWIVGFLCGWVIFEPFSFSVMHMLLQPMSIVGSLGCIFVPLFLSYVSFALSKPVIILIVCYMKAVSFGFSWALLSQIFLSAAWLLQLLLLFSNTSFMIVLFLYWFCGLSADNLPGNADFFLCFSLGFFIAAIDYFVISPFLLGLF